MELGARTMHGIRNMEQLGADERETYAGDSRRRVSFKYCMYLYTYASPTSMP